MANTLIHRQFVGAYVYQLIVDGVVRYVGKGRRYRAIDHFRFARDLNIRRSRGEKVKALRVHNKLAKAMRDGRHVEYKVVVNDLSDEQAYEREVLEISKHPAGQLWNLHSGGSGGDADLTRKMWQAPAFREKTLLAARKGKSDPRYLARAKAIAEAQWSDEEFRERWTKQHRGVWDDPAKAAERRALLKKAWADPVKIASKRLLVKSQWTPERRRAMAENRKAAWSDPEFKRRTMEKVALRKADKEYRERMRKLAKERWADPNFRSRVALAMKASRSK